MPTYIWCCDKCDAHVEVFRTLAEYEVPPGDLDEEDPTCAHRWKRTMQSPMPLRASYLDGQRAKSDKGWASLKEAATLESQMMNVPFQERSEFKREIRKLKEIKK